MYTPLLAHLPLTATILCQVSPNPIRVPKPITWREGSKKQKLTKHQFLKEQKSKYSSDDLWPKLVIYLTTSQDAKQRYNICLHHTGYLQESAIIPDGHFSHPLLLPFSSVILFCISIDSISCCEVTKQWLHRVAKVRLSTVYWHIGMHHNFQSYLPSVEHIACHFPTGWQLFPLGTLYAQQVMGAIHGLYRLCNASTHRSSLLSVHRQHTMTVIASLAHTYCAFSTIIMMCN